ncbi:hypothetical protein [Polymorphobacter fuscus]|uniref:Uncharacterized protein n=1 Tax=Sandarakinorhabdus fusca TaxID=1439888 RepID=A0A7C9GPP5_9SPHN|nr:hypothetical protein [Polymorphobacter fuscus]KAB7646474.1 hypothetical protein F9290_10635 [Polymorphobacter fuscus]MQT17717.1 hypothetical protein [Polymorphobacter fuscus]NJC09735.1 hypothetical protein [Polymorphobacter fuscus]
MRQLAFVTLPLALLVAGCVGEMKGNWPSLAPRPGEVGDAIPVTGPCAGCGQDMVAPAAVPVPVAAPLPLPADIGSRLASVEKTIAAVEAEAPAKARTARAAIAAAGRSADRAGDAEVERSRFESLFLSLSIEEQRLDGIGDDAAGRDGAAAVMDRIAALRTRLAALQQLRTSLPD